MNTNCLPNVWHSQRGLDWWRLAAFLQATVGKIWSSMDSFSEKTHISHQSFAVASCWGRSVDNRSVVLSCKLNHLVFSLKSNFQIFFLNFHHIFFSAIFYFTRVSPNFPQRIYTTTPLACPKSLPSSDCSFSYCSFFIMFVWPRKMLHSFPQDVQAIQSLSCRCFLQLY